MADEDFDMWGAVVQRPPQMPERGLKRYGQLALRGATLGLTGTQIPPQDVGESVAEFAGSVPTIAGISALASPVAGAAARTVPLLRAPSVLPTATRLLGAAGTGAMVGGTQALISGDPVPEGALGGAAQFVAGETAFIGGAKLLGKALKVPPVGKTLTSSPVEQPLKDAMASGQGVPPEGPPRLALPIAKPNGYNTEDFVAGGSSVLNPSRNPQLRQWRFWQPSPESRMLPAGPEARALPRREPPRGELPPWAGPRPPTTEGRVMEPGEVTRGMLPEGRPPRALGPGLEPETLMETRPGYFETGYHPGFEESRPPDIGYFEQQYDERIGRTVLVPKTVEIDNAAKLALGLRPQAEGELPLSEGQIYHLEKPTKSGRPLKSKLDTVTNREPSMVENLLKQPEEVVEEATQKGGSPPIEVHSIELSPAGLEARELLMRSNIAEKDYIEFGSRLKGTREEKIAALLEWLKPRCR